MGGETTTIVTSVISQIQPVITMMINIMEALLANVFFQFLFACGFHNIDHHSDNRLNL